jgi:uncharacterized membrane protein YphA (DoxX/SURF4 family)
VNAENGGVMRGDEHLPPAVKAGPTRGYENEVDEVRQAVDAVRRTYGSDHPHVAAARRREYSAWEAFVDEMAGSASKSAWTQVLGGILLPLGLGLRGASIMAAGRTTLYGTQGAFTMDPFIAVGATAQVVGLIWLCGGALAHFHFFWPHRNRWVCAYGKTLCMAAGFVLLLVAVARMLKG